MLQNYEFCIYSFKQEGFEGVTAGLKRPSFGVLGSGIKFKIAVQGPSYSEYNASGTQVYLLTSTLSLS